MAIITCGSFILGMRARGGRGRDCGFGESWSTYYDKADLEVDQRHIIPLHNHGEEWG